MSNCKTKLIGRGWLWTAVIGSVVLMNAATGLSQETKPANKTDEKATATAPATKAPPADPPATKSDAPPAAPAADSKPAEAPSTPPAADKKATEPATPATSGPVVTKSADTGAPASTPPTSNSPANEKVKDSATAMPAGKTQSSLAEKASEQAGKPPVAPVKEGWNVWVMAFTLLALFILPILAGNYLGRIWRMPDYGWKFSLVIGVLAGSILICWFGTFKYGPDLAGGITLIYELSDAKTVTAPSANQPAAAANPAAGKTVKSGNREINITELIGALKKRLDPDGTKEISIREYGSSAVEIIIPQVGQDERDYVKQKITALGQLEFRITADPTMQKDKKKIDLAKLAPPTQKLVMQGDDVVAKWVPYDVKTFGTVDQPNGMVKRMAGDTAEVLVLVDPMNVTGKYLKSARKGLDDRGGGPAVHFSFDSEGARRFEKLTSQNLPNPATPDVRRHLGILLDNKLVNAPTIESTISDQGQISGSSMTDKEVELTVEVLNAGSLPEALNKTPISEEFISPTLGKITVEKGKFAIGASMVGVVLFMLVYYRFAGVVACIVLTLNLLMVLALMVLIRAAFTLPGLAGLALTVGMSVDANVLIYERIREELRHGAAMRMAIRNGFSRALTAIIDSNLTSILTGIVLFQVGTDQVKGFAVTLVLGVCTSMFTAIFTARLIFDVAERRGWLKELKMMHIFSEPNYDFLSIRWYALGASWLLIAVGMVAVYFRGSQLLDIDFTGGSSVTFTLKPADKMPLVDVRNVLMKTVLFDKNLLIVERGDKDTSYTVDTSEQSVENVKDIIDDQFKGKLMKYSLEFSDPKPVTEEGFTGAESKLSINAGKEYEEEGGVGHDALQEQLAATLVKLKHPGVQPAITNPNYTMGSVARYTDWTVRLPGTDADTAKAVLGELQTELRGRTLFPLASTIGGRVSSDMQFHAFYAVGISLVAMILYLWFRFQKPAYGIAAGVALIHDVFVTVGMIAISYYIVEWVPGLASALKIDAFQINLTIVAALLTIIGYSVHDTIVTFDRLREIKGKTPNLTAEMVNDSVNQTLSRTILTVFTVFITVVTMYFFGGEGLHSFAYAFLVGILVGTYSSVYVASPVLLWISGVSAAPERHKVEPSTRGMQPAR